MKICITAFLEEYRIIRNTFSRNTVNAYPLNKAWQYFINQINEHNYGRLLFAVGIVVPAECDIQVYSAVNINNHMNTSPRVERDHSIQWWQICYAQQMCDDIKVFSVSIPLERNRIRLGNIDALNHTDKTQYCLKVDEQLDIGNGWHRFRLFFHARKFFMA